MLATSHPINVVINPITAQFEAVQRSEVAGILAYERAGTHFDLRHTFVPRNKRGNGIARVLVAGALSAIRASGGMVTPSCSYVRAFMEAHPEYEDLVSPDPFPAGEAPPTQAPGLAAITSQSIVEVVDVQVDRIVSNRVVLRPWTLDDTEDALAIYQDEKVVRWTRPFIQPVADRNAMRRRLDSWITQSNRSAHPQGRWAIELADSGALIGGAALLAVTLNGQNLLAMSWELASCAVGNGLAAEAGHALVHYAFRVSNATAVHAVIQPTNERGIATLRRVGLTKGPGLHSHLGAEVEVYGIDRDDLDLSAARRSLSLTD